MTRIAILFLSLFSLVNALAQTSSPLGLPTSITDLYVPGSLIEVIPRKDNESSLVIRIIETKTAAVGHRYDLEVYGLDPGTHQLSDFLRYADSKAPLSGLDHTVTVTTRHPLDTLPNPEELEHIPPPKLGGYRTLIIALGILWLLVLLALIFYRKKQADEVASTIPPPTLHEKLNLLVTAASRGDLSDHERSELERLIIGHWKKEIPDLAQVPPARALAQLRQHPEASPLVLKLEEWLHAPNPSLSHTDIAPLLAHYRIPSNQ